MSEPLFIVNKRHYTDLNNVRDSGVQGVPCTSTFRITIV